MEDKIEVNMKYFYDDIVKCLTKYQNIPYEESRKILENSHIYNAYIDNDESEIDDVLGHELPYFWAMLIFFMDSNPEWDDDPKLWPPPKAEMEKWYGGNFIV